MFRLRSTFQNLSLTVDAFCVNYNSLQTLRWRRKPRWLPTAKSKLFRVPERTVLPEEEKLELMRLYNGYRTQIKSLKRYLDRRYNIRYKQSVDVEQHKREFEEDFIRCNVINEQWNTEQKIVREKRIAEIMEKDAETARQRLAVRKEIWEDKRKEAEELVRREIEASKSFITPEKLDEAIEKAIANTVDFNFAIDKDGNKIVGRETKPEIERKVSLKQ